MNNYFFKYLILATILVGCATPHIDYDYDKSIDYTQYKTFNFQPNLNIETINKLEGEKLLRFIEAEMLRKGFTKSETPDIYLDIIPKSEKFKQQQSSVGVGMGSSGTNIGVGFGIQLPLYAQKVHIELLINIYDTNTTNLIWEGVFTHDTGIPKSPEEKTLLMQNVVAQNLKNFPPIIQKN